jgi:hypothetical protein
LTIIIIDLAGEPLIELDHSTRTLARHLERGDLVRTTEPLVYRLIREAALIPLDPNKARKLSRAKHGGPS